MLWNNLNKWGSNVFALTIACMALVTTVMYVIIVITLKILFIIFIFIVLILTIWWLSQQVGVI